MLHLKWGRHAETSSEVGLGGPDPPTADSLWHPGSIGDPVPRLWAPMTLYLLVTCWAALRFREKNGWEGVLQTERHFWILWTTPSRVLNPRVVVASEKQGQQHPKPNTWEADSQVQVHSENFRCSQGRWRRLLHKIPFEIFIWLWPGSDYLPCWVHFMFLLPRNLPSLLSSGTFRMKHCCILQPTSCLIFDGKNMTCRNAILLLSICLQMVSCFPDYYSAFYFAKKCFSNILEGSLLSVMKCVIRIFRVPQSWRNLATGQLRLCP